ncbi:uncharacterized protein METZ01_LOCUS85011 [marine metagenome]|uniref:Uncharacterized protein n=1 Tax=marine metagenome TaxID=408172 RepID=A0A381UXQ8_9ZZZZ
MACFAARASACLSNRSRTNASPTPTAPPATPSIVSRGPAVALHINILNPFYLLQKVV